MATKKKKQTGIKKTNLVEKRNVLNELRCNDMSLQEMRFFSIYLSRINARDTSTRVVTFPLEEFQKIMGLGRMNIHHFQNITNSLLGKVVNVWEINGYSAFQLFKRCRVYQDESKQWFVQIDAHDDALSLMFDFKRDYFTYELWNTLRLRSRNQFRMYEVLKQYEKAGSRELSLSELKRLLGIGEREYPRWDNFKRCVLDSCQEALAEYTDIKFSYTPIKTGSRITGVLFVIEQNKGYEDPLSLSDFIDLQKAKDETDANIIIDEEGVSPPQDAGVQVISVQQDEIPVFPHEGLPKEDDDEEPLSFDDPNAIYADALPSDFTPEQVEAIRILAARKVRNPQDLDIANYLYSKVAQMRAVKNVQYPYKYLLAMIAADPDVSWW